ncbi:MAG: hypothetical protein UY32_C0034G0005 [Candidatus Jorgensenbacteria bacterium GW2011_GWC1_48_8]|uniref:Uncharacterized protein n=1 Tax=Candidatus Jorgensenbacteria bacterium GW2011_GWC1_48_8 TaxID=1618666 RepID=A0A0G1UVF0_9BACT|nr:MAG: hypothetical protein UY32_C0034G0005 [Candidatus Jorgensenbacteria bacterium GW2011_GWC1_48_8]
MPKKFEGFDPVGREWSDYTDQELLYSLEEAIHDYIEYPRKLTLFWAKALTKTLKKRGYTLKDIEESIYL